MGTVVTGIVGAKNLDDPYFEPFFREANELGAAVGVHWITGCFDSPGQERFKDPYFYIHMVGMPFNLMIGIMTLDRRRHHGKISQESNLSFWKSAPPGFPTGCGAWTIITRPALIVCPLCPKPPSEYVRSESCFVSCEPDEEGLAHTAEVLGAERIIFASDYPHGDCDFPHTVTKLRKRKDLGDELKEHILWKNAATALWAFLIAREIATT